MKRFLVLGFLLGWAITSFASGPRRVTFNQSVDCPFVGGWELAYEPAVSAGAEPSGSALGASIPNTGPCGLSTSAIVAVVGVGTNRFWLRAVSTDGSSRSAYSNSVDASVPFASPVLVSVGD